jgi:hypothetical protein
MQLAIAKEFIHRLEVARDCHQLLGHEECLVRELKRKSLMLSSLQCTIARQESRILWLSDIDAPTRFFHLHANARRRRKCIRSLEHDGQTLVDEN